MTKNCELTVFEYEEIIGLFKSEYSVRKIAKTLGYPKFTVQDVITKYKEENRTDAAPWPSRPLLLTEQDKRYLVRIVHKDRKQAVEEITEEFNQTLNVLVSKRTI